MADREKLSCPDCGVGMNLHAEKVNYTPGPEADGAAFDDEFGGAVEEFHACPECGRTHARRAA